MNEQREKRDSGAQLGELRNKLLPLEGQLAEIPGRIQGLSTHPDKQVYAAVDRAKCVG